MKKALGLQISVKTDHNCVVCYISIICKARLSASNFWEVESGTRIKTLKKIVIDLMIFTKIIINAVNARSCYWSIFLKLVDTE